MTFLVTLSDLVGVPLDLVKRKKSAGRTSSCCQGGLLQVMKTSLLLEKKPHGNFVCRKDHYPPGNAHISPQKWHFEDDFPFPKVGYVSSLEGKSKVGFVFLFFRKMTQISWIEGCKIAFKRIYLKGWSETHCHFFFEPPKNSSRTRSLDQLSGELPFLKLTMTVRP